MLHIGLKWPAPSHRGKMKRFYLKEISDLLYKLEFELYRDEQELASIPDMGDRLDRSENSF